ncbi:MAG: hypothetical protein MJY45_02210 [Bacteroidales bacterium]|nr:hypothetical protein [Bacteroidales bacterium]
MTVNLTASGFSGIMAKLGWVDVVEAVSYGKGRDMTDVGYWCQHCTKFGLTEDYLHCP